ncbi:MAG: hypothetical protein ACYC0Q_00450 [Eubacteriales bacterium]
MNRNQMVRLLKILLEEELTEKARLLTFGEAGVLTTNEGLVVRLADGKEFQITIVQSRIGKEDE